MLDRVCVGDVPAKPHTRLHGPDGALRWEECFTRRGFSGAYSILYHERRPHPSRVIPANYGWQPPEPAPDAPLARRHYLGTNVGASGGAPVQARKALLFNADITVGLACPTAHDPVYVANADADELIFIHEGSGTLVSPFGDLRYEALDYVCVPKGVPHRFLPDPGVPQRWLTMACPSGVGLLQQWRNEVGQLKMEAPYSHRDFRRPTFVGPVDDGVRELVVLREGRWTGFELPHSPRDVVGWDGTVYPWVFPILNFQPRVSSVHLPPDWHGTFSTHGALICSFVPRLVDFHPAAIPCPYPHSSVDCDEVLYYVQGNFTSRRGVGPGSVSFHPYGIPHGPHPGALEASIGTTRTDELAVMIDTFKPLRPTMAAVAVEDAEYHDSFSP
jgi:homogentisate 1,2-dioxygenase